MASPSAVTPSVSSSGTQATINHNHLDMLDDLFILTNQIWIELLDYEKVVEQIFKLEKYTQSQNTKPIHITVPKNNFRLSVGEGVKKMYDIYRERQWEYVKESVQSLEHYSRQYRGTDLHMNITTDHGEIPPSEDYDWASMYWKCVDTERSRAS